MLGAKTVERGSSSLSPPPAEAREGEDSATRQSSVPEARKVTRTEVQEPSSNKLPSQEMRTSLQWEISALDELVRGKLT